MKTAELIEHGASEAGLEKAAAKKAVEAVLGGIIAAAKQGDEVTLGGFGKFKVKDNPARQGRSPGHRRNPRDSRIAQAGFHASEADEGRLDWLTGC